MKITIEPIPDEFYTFIECDGCKKKLGKFLPSNGVVILEYFNTLCRDCFDASR